ncbi:tyrosine-type recombinase/integrase [Micromonospora orduensis]|uniref:tyrosine-type recombinase/integrase n=1 Tax=Micromonospora orduensis TaxID=1420891 RepID=UPI001FCAD545|nr:tyrosine-type recombinase/integrase [Micromonospora orduensis]
MTLRQPAIELRKALPTCPEHNKSGPVTRSVGVVGGLASGPGWPKEGTFHSLRHFFATTLMSNGAEPQKVQKALRHANLRITLETYVHWLPKKDRRAAWSAASCGRQTAIV